VPAVRRRAVRRTRFGVLLPGCPARGTGGANPRPGSARLSGRHRDNRQEIVTGSQGDQVYL